MAVQLYASIWRITAQVTPEPVVLLEYGDYLEGPLQFTPEPEVDAAPFLGGGARTFARPNVFHTISYRVWKLHANIPLAAAYQISHSIDLKTLAGVDFHIEVLNHDGHAVLNKGTVARYPSDHYERCTRFGIELIGGALSSTLAAVSVLGLPDGSAITLPDGSYLGLPDEA